MEHRPPWPVPFAVAAVLAALGGATGCVPLESPTVFGRPCADDSGCGDGYACVAEQCRPTGVGACPEDGELLVLDSQAELDALACTGVVAGSLEVRGATNLAPFANVGRITGRLEIHASPNLVSLTGLDGVTAIEGGLLIDETGLTNLEGLEDLTRAGGLELYANPALESLAGLDSLDDVVGNLSVVDGASFVSLAGTGGLNSLEGALYLENTRVTDLSGLGPPTEIGGLFLVNNPLLQSVDGLEALTQVDGDLVIRDNPLLTDLSALCGLRGRFDNEGGITGTESCIQGNESLPRYEAECIAIDKVNVDRLANQVELGLTVCSDQNLEVAGTCSCNQ